MSKLSESELDFIKIYFLTLIIISAITLIYGALYFIFGESQKSFLGTYKSFIITIGLVSYFIEIILTIMSVFALIKFTRKNSVFVYIYSMWLVS